MRRRGEGKGENEKKETMEGKGNSEEIKKEEKKRKEKNRKEKKRKEEKRSE